MRASRLYAVAAAAAGLAMFAPSPMRGRQFMPLDVSRKPYHQEGDAVLMDWDLPRGKRAKRRARGRRLSSHKGTADG